MVTLRFLGPPGSGIQLDGRTYAPGEVADIPERWALPLVRAGRAVAVTAPLAPAERVSVAEMEHRDPRPARRR